MTKPFTEIQLQRSIELTVSQLSLNEETNKDETVFSHDHLFIKSGQQLEKVIFNEIIYLEANGRYTNVITKEKNT